MVVPCSVNFGLKFILRLCLEAKVLCSVFILMWFTWFHRSSLGSRFHCYTARRVGVVSIIWGQSNSDSHFCGVATKCEVLDWTRSGSTSSGNMCISDNMEVYFYNSHCCLPHLIKFRTCNKIDKQWKRDQHCQPLIAWSWRLGWSCHDGSIAAAQCRHFCQFIPSFQQIVMGKIYKNILVWCSWKLQIAAAAASARSDSTLGQKRVKVTGTKIPTMNCWIEFARTKYQWFLLKLKYVRLIIFPKLIRFKIIICLVSPFAPSWDWARISFSYCEPRQFLRRLIAGEEELCSLYLLHRGG